jgi:hypothetical protein
MLITWLRIRWALLPGLLLLLTSGLLATIPAPVLQAQEDQPFPELDLVLLIDESGSMWLRTDREQGSSEVVLDEDTGVPVLEWPDIPPYRIQAAQMLINMLATEQRTTGEAGHRVSVYLFGEEVKLAGGQVLPDGRVLPVVENFPVAGNAEEINTAIVQTHYDLGNNLWTDTEMALEQAYQVLEPLNEASRRSVVVLITDGRPERENANLLEGADTPEGQAYGGYLEDIKTTISRLDEVPNARNACPDVQNARPVYLLGVDTEALTALAGTPYVSEEYRSFWEQANVVGDQYRPVSNFSRLNSEVTALVSELLCAPAPVTRGPDSPPITYEYEMQSNYSSAIFSISKSQLDTRIIIFDAAGNPIESDQLGVEQTGEATTSEVWTFNQQEFGGEWSGTWEVKIEGSGGTVEFNPTFFTENYSIDLIEPKGDSYPAGRALNLIGRVLDEDGTTIPSEDINFTIEYSIDGEEPTEGSVDGPDDGGSFSHTIERPIEGTYEVNMRAVLPDGQTASLAPAKTFYVGPFPFPQIVQPGSNVPLPVAAPINVSVSALEYNQASEQTQPVNLIKAQDTEIFVIIQPVDGSTTVELPDETQLEVAADPLNPQITHEGSILAPAEPGEYYIIVRLEYNTTGGTKIFTDSRRISLAEPPDTPVPENTSVPSPTPGVPPAPEPSDPINPLVPLGVLGSLGAAGAYWFMNRGPKLNGTSLISSGGNTIHLRGRQHNLPLHDDTGTKVGVMQFRQVPDGTGGRETMARISKLAPGQNLKIQGTPVAEGDDVPVKSGDTIMLPNGEFFNLV